MDAITQHRKKRLEQLISAAPYNGDRSAFMTRANLSKGRISQLLDPTEQFGEVSARRLCQALDLPEGWFEQGAPGKPMAWPFLLLTVRQAAELSKDNLETVEKLALDLLARQRTNTSASSNRNNELPSGHGESAERKPIRAKRVAFKTPEAKDRSGTGNKSTGKHRHRGT